MRFPSQLPVNLSSLLNEFYTYLYTLNNTINTINARCSLNALNATNTTNTNYSINAHYTKNGACSAGRNTNAQLQINTYHFNYIAVCIF